MQNKVANFTSELGFQLRAVLFDMDGVIIDSEPLHKRAYIEMFEEIGIEVNDDLYTKFTGRATLDICRQLKETFELSHAPEELVKKKRNNFKRLFDSDTSLKLITGVRDLIENYHSNAIKMVLASSATMETIDWVLQKFDLEKYFLGKVSGAELKQSKPHPEIFELASEISGEKRQNCMVIEDATSGILAANAAGIYCVAFKSPNSKNQNYDKAQKVISDYREIMI